MYAVYLIIHIGSFFATLFVILQTIGSDTVREGMKTKSQVRVLAMNVFGSWDYTINSRGAIKEQQRSLGSNFKVGSVIQKL